MAKRPAPSRPATKAPAPVGRRLRPVERLTGALRWLWRWTRRALAAALLISVLQVLLVRFVNPPFTVTMLERVWQQHEQSGRWLWVDYRPRYSDQLGEGVARAAVAAEDARFWHHHGFDLEGICRALRRNQRAGDAVAGGSTISQQVARNVFLWQERSWLRKGLEAWYTALLELIVPKRRILELYLNVAETGPMRFGVEAGARHHFGEAARALDADQAARLVALLPNPRRWRTDEPQVKKRAAKAIQSPVAFPGDAGFAAAAAEHDAEPLISPACRGR